MLGSAKFYFVYPHLMFVPVFHVRLFRHFSTFSCLSRSWQPADCPTQLFASQCPHFNSEYLLRNWGTDIGRTILPHCSYIVRLTFLEWINPCRVPGARFWRSCPPLIPQTFAPFFLLDRWQPCVGGCCLARLYQNSRYRQQQSRTLPRVKDLQAQHNFTLVYYALGCVFVCLPTFLPAGLILSENRFYDLTYWDIVPVQEKGTQENPV